MLQIPKATTPFNLSFLHFLEQIQTYYLLTVFNLSGDSRFPDHQHADGAAQLFSGATAVLLSNRGPRGAAAGAPNPSQSHRQARQHAQVLQHKVCVSEVFYRETVHSCRRNWLFVVLTQCSNTAEGVNLGSCCNFKS